MDSFTFVAAVAVEVAVVVVAVAAATLGILCLVTIESPENYYIFGWVVGLMKIRH